MKPVKPQNYKQQPPCLRVFSVKPAHVSGVKDNNRQNKQQQVSLTVFPGVSIYPTKGRGVLEPIPPDITWRQGTPWTSRQLWLTQRHQQPHARTFTPVGNLNSPVNQMKSRVSLDSERIAEPTLSHRPEIELHHRAALHVVSYHWF